MDDQMGAMAADGAYQEGAATQHGAAGIGLPLVQAAFEDLTIAADGPPVMLADFGAADGSNSLAPIGAALHAVRRKAPTRPVLAVHADIVGNDFSTLARTLTTSPDRYTTGDPHVLPTMVARSLFGPVLPPDSLTFGWTASTLHWLSAAPGPVADHFFVQSSGDADAKRAYAAQSRADWTAFLDARATELVPGASVVIVDVLMDHDGLMGSEALFDVLNAALRQNLTGAEFSDVMYPTWFRSVAELQAPFTPDYRGLELVDVTQARLPDPFAELAGEPDAYAIAQVDFLRGFLEPSFAAAMSPDRTAVLTSVWDDARSAIAADPVGVEPDYRLVTCRVRRADPSWSR